MTKQITSEKSKLVAQRLTRGRRHIQSVIDRGVRRNGIVYVTDNFDPDAPIEDVRAYILNVLEVKKI